MNIQFCIAVCCLVFALPNGQATNVNATDLDGVAIKISFMNEKDELATREFTVASNHLWITIDEDETRPDKRITTFHIKGDEVLENLELIPKALQPQFYNRFVVKEIVICGGRPYEIFDKLLANRDVRIHMKLGKYAAQDYYQDVKSLVGCDHYHLHHVHRQNNNGLIELIDKRHARSTTIRNESVYEHGIFGWINTLNKK